MLIYNYIQDMKREHKTSIVNKIPNVLIFLIVI